MHEHRDAEASRQAGLVSGAQLFASDELGDVVSKTAAGLATRARTQVRAFHQLMEDLRASGWEVGVPERRGGQLTWLTLRKPFATPQEATAVLADAVGSALIIGAFAAGLVLGPTLEALVAGALSGLVIDEETPAPISAPSEPACTLRASRRAHPHRPAFARSLCAGAGQAARRNDRLA